MAEISHYKSSLQEKTLMSDFKDHFNYTPEYKELTKDFYLKFQ